jgi:hypothetical protein
MSDTGMLHEHHAQYELVMLNWTKVVDLLKQDLRLPQVSTRQNRAMETDLHEIR